MKALHKEALILVGIRYPLCPQRGPKGTPPNIGRDRSFLEGLPFGPRLDRVSPLSRPAPWDTARASRAAEGRKTTAPSKKRASSQSFEKTIFLLGNPKMCTSIGKRKTQARRHTERATLQARPPAPPISELREASLRSDEFL